MTGADLDPGCPLDDTGGGEWARPLDDGAWVGPDGVTWRRRGDRELDLTAVRRLLRRGARVFHAYGVTPHEHTGGGVDALLDRLEQFRADKLGPHASFRVAELRAPDRSVVVMVQEEC